MRNFRNWSRPMTGRNFILLLRSFSPPFHRPPRCHSPYPISTGWDRMVFIWSRQTLLCRKFPAMAVLWPSPIPISVPQLPRCLRGPHADRKVNYGERRQLSSVQARFNSAGTAAGPCSLRGYYPINLRARLLSTLAQAKKHRFLHCRWALIFQSLRMALYWCNRLKSACGNKISSHR